MNTQSGPSSRTRSHSCSRGAKALALSLFCAGALGTAHGAVSPESEDENSAAPAPRLKFITTGGTIQHLRKPDGTNARIPLEEVMANIRDRYPQPEVAAILDGIDPSFEEVTLVGSGSFDTNEFLSIALAAQNALDDGFDAVIVTQGTTSSEYTCYFLNLLVDTDKPIVVTNSQRQHMSVGNDGDRNLLDSILVATDPASGGKGALQVEGAEIVSCREVTKNSSRPGAFGAQRGGILGYLQGGTLGMGAIGGTNVAFYAQPTRKHTSRSEFSIRDLMREDGTFNALPQVEILPSYYSANPGLVHAMVSLGVEGIVVQGQAAGGSIHSTHEEPVRKLAAEGMPVVRTHTNQVAYDGRITPSASGPYIGGDNLPAHKARILLQLAMEKTGILSGEERRLEIQRLFSTH